MSVTAACAGVLVSPASKTIGQCPEHDIGRVVFGIGFFVVDVQFEGAVLVLDVDDVDMSLLEHDAGARRGRRHTDQNDDCGGGGG
ncbi:hypothetical protein HKK72_13580 [Actinomadura sp. HBU206391]|nr:hypothetical protein [Actinomadura sp. HBU206391]